MSDLTAQIDIESLEKEVRSLTSKLEELATVKAQLAGAQRDAERYRWIRDNNAVDWEGGGLEIPADAPDEVWDVYELMIDAAVDAALAKHKEQT